MHSPGTRVAGLWQGPMEAITIQIITSVIKETLGENSSELILPQSRLGSREQKGCLDLDKLHVPRCIFFSQPKGSGNRATGQIPAHRLSCLCCPGSLLAHPCCKMKQAGLPQFAEVEAGSQHLSASVTRHARVNSYNSFADAQELAG